MTIIERLIETASSQLHFIDKSNILIVKSGAEPFTELTTI